MFLGFAITPDQRIPQEQLPGEDLVCHVSSGHARGCHHARRTHSRKGRSAVIVHLGRAGRGYRCRAVARGCSPRRWLQRKWNASQQRISGRNRVLQSNISRHVVDLRPTQYRTNARSQKCSI